MRRFCTDVVRIFRSSRAFDKEGIFIGDASYLFVPDDPNYENSVKLLFDEPNHPISSKKYEKMPHEQKAHITYLLGDGLRTNLTPPGTNMCLECLNRK